MVFILKINYCPSCGAELIEGSFICPLCSVDVEELFAKGYLLGSNNEENSIELFKSDEEMIMVDNPELDINSADEIVIVIPAEENNDEIIVDLDELGIDVENLDENVNIVIEVDGADFENNDGMLFDDEMPPNEWFFDDDPYEIVYYEFVNMRD